MQPSDGDPDWTSLTLLLHVSKHCPGPLDCSQSTAEPESRASTRLHAQRLGTVELQVCGNPGVVQQLVADGPCLEAGLPVLQPLARQAPCLRLHRLDGSQGIPVLSR